MLAQNAAANGKARAGDFEKWRLILFASGPLDEESAHALLCFCSMSDSSEFRNAKQVKCG